MIGQKNSNVIQEVKERMLSPVDQEVRKESASGAGCLPTVIINHVSVFTEQKTPYSV